MERNLGVTEEIVLVNIQPYNYSVSITTGVTKFCKFLEINV